MIATRSGPVLRMKNASLRLVSSQKGRRRTPVAGRCIFRGFATSGINESTASGSGNKSPSSPQAPPTVGEAALDTDAAAALAAAASVATQTQPPKVLFPWRHETEEHMLPRLVPGTPESRYHTGLTPFEQTFVAWFFLNVPWWQILSRWWRSELAEYTGYAFARGVAGIVSNVYRVPLDDIWTDESPDGDWPSLDFQYQGPTSTPLSEKEGDEEGSRFHEAPSIKSGGAFNKDASSGTTADSSPDRYSPEVDNMLDRPLRRLFQSAHEDGRDRLQIRLQTAPTSRCQVVSLFCIPFVTPQAVERDPTILDRMESFMTKTSWSDMPGVSELVQEQARRHGKLETTVELQVLVECDEAFQVVDSETGTVLQGSSDGAVRRVWHLVRLENTSTMTLPLSFFSLPNIDNWIITDIDDLLGPKKWYHK